MPVSAPDDVRGGRGSARSRVLVLGGGFGGAYAAMALERRAARGVPLEVALVNRENYLVFQPMLAEVLAGDVGMLDTVTPLRQLLPRTELFVREVSGIDLERRVVTLDAGLGSRALELRYDQLVLALGAVTDFRGVPGLPEHALPFKTLADAVRIRNHVIDALEQASVARERELRSALLTFVIAGGGFSGTEAAAALGDFVRAAARTYSSLPAEEIRVVLVHSGGHVLERELTGALARYSTATLAEHGIELLLRTRLVAASPRHAVLSDGTRIATRTLISTVPSSPNPVLERLGLAHVGGRLRCEPTLALAGRERVWALGDCAHVPMPGGEPCPATAQHAIRQARLLAANLAAVLAGAPARPFSYAGRGKLGALGHRRAVAELPGGVCLAGVSAWLLWRGVYWSKLPGRARKTRVLLSWLGDAMLPPHPVQLKLGGGRGASHAHYEPGETVFEQGDDGDCLYMIVAGEVEVLRRVDDALELVRTLGPGEYFGELALLERRPRSAGARARSSLDLLVLPAGDFAALAGGLSEFREAFEAIAHARTQADAARAARPS
ncbi:MAG TPA: FAD-dependent oxidoreductase [Solirubrobacteraceae bacterium]|nr:FAD-dependent oxidoreductase [Solirubrobacteraceae bacterium]